MAGAMRRMGIYLGLVEDDDARGYGRYDTRQSEHPEHDRRYGGRYADDRYDDRYDDEYAGSGYVDDDLEDEVPAAREPEALPVRRERAVRPIGLAPAGAGAGPSRVGAMSGSAMGGSAIGGSAMGSGPVGATAAKLAVREPVAVVAEPAPAPAPQPYRITTLHPRTYNEARTIGERFRDGMPVIMNLSEMDDADAKRLVDFAAGLSFGLRGSIERVTAKVFLLSPQNVDVTAEDKARIREGGFFNQS
ncbi:cell division protein SepF [Blastococcus haudaquaticus]|uniref:Cell division protein SepF n=1 Tax=Blastococcus haudaquaticus TaxID=1938745 RepID=A0A286H4P0_9ACTN|nr:cell division protein SepF [Blastococcus haudaquaticus]SOE02770.1 cell division inhibitor SepF [Blastococcus haudaquaticus]